MIRTLNITVLALLLVGAAVYVGYNTYTTNASVITGGEYQAQELTSADSGTSTVKRAFGSIGSIVVENSSAAATIVLYDTASTTIATTSATQLLSFDAAAGEGTYQYDVRFNEGLLIDVGTAFDGDVVITYR